MPKLSAYKLAIFKNISWLTADQFIRMGLNAVLTFMVARFYGKESYGALNVGMAFIMLFSPLMNLGYDGYMIKDLLNEKNNHKEIMGTAFLMRFIGSIISASIIFLYIFSFNKFEPQTELIIIILSLSLIFQSFDVFEVYFKSELKAKYSFYTKTLAFILSSSIKLFLIYTRSPLWMFAAISIFELLLVVLFQNYYYRKLSNLFLNSWFFLQNRFKYILKECWPLLVNQLASIIYLRIDQIFLALILGEGFAGEYAASSKIYEILINITIIVNTSLFPLVNNLFNTNKKKFEEICRLNIELYTLFSIFALVVINIFSKDIIQIAFGKDFEDSYKVLNIQMISLIALFNGALRSPILNLYKNQKYLVIITTIGAVTSIIFNLLLIKKLGIVGSAITSAITMFVTFLFSNLLFKETRFLFKWQILGFIPIITTRKLLQFIKS